MTHAPFWRSLHEMAEVVIHFYSELNDILPQQWQDVEFTYVYNGPQSVKHLIEAIGVPHPEVALILADGQPVGFDHQPADGSHIGVYPEGNGVVVDGAPPLRPPLPEPIAFLTDNHLGRLTRFQRLLGFDTAYGGTAADDLLAERAHLERLVAEVELRSMSNASYSLRPIGFIRSSLTDRLTAPNQGSDGAPDAWLEIIPEVAAGLEGIAAGDAIIVVTWLHQSQRDVLRLHPQWNEANPLTGVFNTRSPDRPNPLGLHRVRVRQMDGNKLLIGPIEVIDGTPVVDIKPLLADSSDV